MSTTMTDRQRIIQAIKDSDKRYRQMLGGDVDRSGRLSVIKDELQQSMNQVILGVLTLETLIEIKTQLETLTRSVDGLRST